MALEDKKFKNPQNTKDLETKNTPSLGRSNKVNSKIQSTGQLRKDRNWRDRLSDKPMVSIQTWSVAK